jgi:hypothetical protein
LFTRQLQNFQFPNPVDPFGKASACLREAASAKAGAEPFDDRAIRVVRLPEFTRGEFDPFTLLVKQTGLLKPWRMG